MYIFHQGDKIQRARNVSSNWQLKHAAKKRYFPPKRRFLQEPQGVTSHKTAFFIVTAMKTSNLTFTAHPKVARKQTSTLKREVKLPMCCLDTVQYRTICCSYRKSSPCRPARRSIQWAKWYYRSFRPFFLLPCESPLSSATRHRPHFHSANVTLRSTFCACALDVSLRHCGTASRELLARVCFRQSVLSIL
jgi:hypothetical protein